ncbi:MAG: ComEC/Rec2 family competence protein [Phycisphaerales bacterium]
MNRRVPLKGGPAATALPVARAEVGQTLVLVSANPTNNYYHVAYPTGQQSWIYKGFVSLQPGPPPDTVAPPPAGSLKVHVINVGQGDATLIVCPDGDHQLLIDTGDTRYPGAKQAFQNALSVLQSQDDPIEVVVATHPHADHIGNMAWLLRQYQVVQYVDNGEVYNTATYREVERTLTQRGVHRDHASTPGLKIKFCSRADVSITVLAPSGFGESHNPNNNSVILRLDYGEDSLLFVGDAEDDEEEQLLADAAIKPRLDCDFLKAGHHGSDTSSTEPFLDAVTPDVAVITPGEPNVGTNVGYKHPRRSTVDRLLAYVRPQPGPARSLRTYDADAKRWTTTTVDRSLYSTSIDGDILVESNGRGITVRPDR